ncbi:MAG: efflux RND transporter periplasmic adaptor subunit [Paracoccaceae bacterium]
MTSRIPFYVAGAVAVAAAGYFALSGSHNTTKPAATETAATGSDETSALAPTAPSITVAKVQSAVLNDRVRASGLVSAVERVLVQPKIEGQPIDSVSADVGDHVAEGEVLAILSDSALKLQKSQLAASRASALAAIAQADAQLVEAQASADEAMRTKDRNDQLKVQGNVSAAAADQAATAYTSANARVLVATQGASAARAQLELVDAQLENVDLQLNRTKITAPFAGEIVEKNALAGAVASASGQPMFVLVRDGLLELNADVSEQDLARVSTGMRVMMRAAGSPTQFTGSIRLVEPAIDTVTRLGRVRVTVDQADKIRSGMFLEAEISISEREVPTVPITAVGTDSEGTFIMMVDATGLVHRTAVVTGIRDGGLVEIVTGAKAGDSVVAKAASFVRDGDLVNPIAADDAATVTN